MTPSRGADSVQTVPFNLSSVYAPIKQEMEATTALLKERLRHDDATFDGYLEYSFRLGGKRLRPALALLCGKAAGKIDRRCMLVAAALEMIHTGSLVHDDILDGAKFRRGLETINVKWDSQRAVLIGDLLITRAFDLICECEDLEIFRKTSSCCQATVEGELFQTEAIGSFELSVDDYRKIVGGKTASLLECATWQGAYLGGARGDELESFGRFGRNLGIAFQIVDDLLDLVGDETTTGKTLGTDLANKKETLPLILHFQRVSKEERNALLVRLNAGVEAEERAKIADELKRSGALDSAKKVADDLIDETLEIVKELRERASEAKREEALAAFDSLESLARFVVKRDK